MSNIKPFTTEWWKHMAIIYSDRVIYFGYDEMSQHYFCLMRMKKSKLLRGTQDE